MNPQLPELKDIHFPAAPDFWPPALGWWLLLAATLILAYVLFAKTRKYLRIKKNKIAFFNEFAVIEKQLKQSPNKSLIAEMNVLLRRAALVAYPNNQVASLTGSDWLHFLDESGKTTDFSRGAGRILIDAPYRSGGLENYNGDEFISLIKRWIRKNAQKVGGCL